MHSFYHVCTSSPLLWGSLVYGATFQSVIIQVKPLPAGWYLMPCFMVTMANRIFQMWKGSDKKGGLRAFVQPHTKPFGHHGMKRYSNPTFIAMPKLKQWQLLLASSNFKWFQRPSSLKMVIGEVVGLPSLVLKSRSPISDIDRLKKAKSVMTSAACFPTPSNCSDICHVVNR